MLDCELEARRDRLDAEHLKGEIWKTGREIWSTAFRRVFVRLRQNLEKAGTPRGLTQRAGTHLRGSERSTIFMKLAGEPIYPGTWLTTAPFWSRIIVVGNPDTWFLEANRFPSP